MPQSQIFFHVGTGKTGTTFLQYQVFPKLQGIRYIQRTQYKKARQIITGGKAGKYLVSREFDQQLEEEVRRFSASFPQATPIIVFRRHDSYIASQYRRFVKNGFTGKFTDFFDLENDRGHFKRKDLGYMRQIGLLEKHFGPKPIVLVYENMKAEPAAFINQLARLLNVQVDVEKLNLNSKHVSYSEKQLKFVQLAGQYINLRKRRMFRNPVANFFGRLYLGALRYPLLHLARLAPDSLLDPEPLIPPAELEKVRKHYENDWRQCLARAETFMPGFQN